jgi:hypothetical protein
MNIADVIVHYNTVLSQNHRVWTYFQIISCALIGFIWSFEQKDACVFGVIIIIYIGFSWGNCRLIKNSQSNLLMISQSISNYMQENESVIPNSIKPLRKTFYHDSVFHVTALHLIISILTILAILIKYFKF